MIRKEGNDPLLYTITRKATNARRQSSNGSSTSSLYNNFQCSLGSPIGSILQNDDEENDDFDDDDFQEDKHSQFDSKDLNEQHLNLIAFEKLNRSAGSLTANNLNALNLAANYLDQATANEQLSSAFFVSGDSSLMPQSRRHPLFVPKKSNKQRKRKLNTAR